MRWLYLFYDHYLKLALTSPTGGGRSVGTVRVRTKATEFSLPRRKLDMLNNTYTQYVYYTSYYQLLHILS